MKKFLLALALIFSASLAHAVTPPADGTAPFNYIGPFYQVTGGVTGTSAASCFLLENLNVPGFPVPGFYPCGPAADYRLAVDLFPKGSPGNLGLDGIIWFDGCNVDLPSNINLPWVCFHPSVFASSASTNLAENADVFFGTNEGNGAAPGRVLIGDVNRTNHVWLNFLDENDDFNVKEGFVRGAGSTLTTALTSEDVSKNLILQSNTLSNAAWVQSAITSVALTSNEDPFGGSNAWLITTSGTGGSISQAITVPNDGLPYAVAIYVNSASVGTPLFRAAFSGGTGKIYETSLNPATGRVTAFTAQIPTGCGLGPTACFNSNKIQVGCAWGCVSATPQTWWRWWMVVTNNSTGNTALTLTFFPNGPAGGASSAIASAVQLQNGPAPTAYLTTTSAPVTKPAGAIVVAGTAQLTLGAPQTVTYQPGLLTAVNGTIGVFKTFVKASTVDNLVGSAVTFSCVSNPTVTLYECGTSSTCAAPTTIGTVTVTAAGTRFTGTVSSPAVAAGDSIGWAITAGTCASIDIAGNAEVHTN